MTKQHPITPPWELVQQWREAPEFSALSPCVMVTVTNTKLQDIATQAAQWGADQELDACCEWVDWKWSGIKSKELRAHRRPKSPSLKEQALETFDKLQHLFEGYGDDGALIRRALEQLPNNG